MNKFEKILERQNIEEGKRLNRPLDETMLDEFQINDEIRNLLKNKNYKFPDISVLNNSKNALVRKEEDFSAKKHHINANPYFHKHKFVELIYVYRGECRQYIESTENIITIKENELFLLNQNVTHAILPCSKEDILIKIILPAHFLTQDFICEISECRMLADFFTNALLEVNDYYNYIIFRDLHSLVVCDYIKRIVEEYYEEKPYYRQAIRSYLKLLFIQLYRSKLEYENVWYKLSNSSIETTDILSSICEHCSHITLKELSEKFGYNSSYLSRVIKEKTDKTFQQLLKEARLKKAVYLLSDTNMTIEKIAQETGYKNANNLFRLIKTVYNMTPVQFRKQCATKDSGQKWIPCK